MSQAQTDTIADVPVEIDEFWTSRQRRGHSLHEISYRACFKAQLPEYFIERYTAPGDSVLDPFMGRGTTPLQAHLMGRRAFGSDANPLCVMLARPRFDPPPMSEIERRLDEIPERSDFAAADESLLAFYHPDTLRQLTALKQWFETREEVGTFDSVDDWIRMVCINRLSGHSSGFFSVRTMPPNQAVSADRQRIINERNRQTPEPKDARSIVLKKSRSLTRSNRPAAGDRSAGEPGSTASRPVLQTSPADRLDYLPDASIDLAVTSPPFLDVVDYKSDNWLRCWFAGIDIQSVRIDRHPGIAAWSLWVAETLAELARVVKPGGWACFEVGEIRSGSLNLETAVLDALIQSPWRADRVLVNLQDFTKTSHLWGVSNNRRGTNTNRIVVMQRSA